MSVKSPVTSGVCAYELGRKFTEDRLETFTGRFNFLYSFLAG